MPSRYPSRRRSEAVESGSASYRAGAIAFDGSFVVQHIARRRCVRQGVERVLTA